MNVTGEDIKRYRGVVLTFNPVHQIMLNKRTYDIITPSSVYTVRHDFKNIYSIHLTFKVYSFDDDVYQCITFPVFTFSKEPIIKTNDMMDKISSDLSILQLTHKPNNLNGDRLIIQDSSLVLCSPTHFHRHDVYMLSLNDIIFFNKYIFGKIWYELFEELGFHVMIDKDS